MNRLQLMVLALILLFLGGIFIGYKLGDKEAAKPVQIEDVITLTASTTASVSPTATPSLAPKPNISPSAKPTASVSPKLSPSITPKPTPLVESPPLPTPVVSTSAPRIGKCQVFPADNPWNQDISSLPVHPNSAAYVAAIGNRNLHPDFGGNGEYGIPFRVVSGSQPKVPITFTDYGDESDPGPYPIPSDAPIEGGASSSGDRHVIVLEDSSCTLYELYNARPNGAGWSASSGAVFNLLSNILRPKGWTSADAAGLPILPGLVRYDEVAAGAVRHAVRFTAPKTQRAFIAPATHFASSSSDPNLPPMGLRVRLKASYDISAYNGQTRVILEGLKKYGMILADNGSGWFITGAADSRWNDDDLGQLKKVPGSAFEAVDTGPLLK